MTRRPRHRQWTEFNHELLEEVATGVELVIRRRATVALAHADDITQDINEIIQRRFFTKGRTLHEGVLRKLISQETLTKHQRTYYPKMTEAQIAMTQRMMSRMLDSGSSVINGYSGELLNAKEWELAKVLDTVGWSATRAAEASGIPVGTVLRRRDMIYYKLTTYNQKQVETYPVSLTVMIEKNTEEELHSSPEQPATTNLHAIISECDQLSEADKSQLTDYLEGKRSSKSLDSMLDRMDLTGENITSEHRKALQELREAHEGKEVLQDSLDALEGLTEAQRVKLLDFLTSEPTRRELQSIISKIKGQQ